MTVTPDDVTRIYGNNTPAFSVSYSGFKNSENIATINGYAGSPALDGPVDTSAWAAGLYSDQVDLTGTTETATNYTFVIDNGDPGDITINLALLTISGVSTSKIYGDANPVLLATGIGYVGADTDAILVGNPTTTALLNSPVGLYVIDPTGVIAPNYSIVYANGVLTIDPAALTITTNDSNKTYGTANPAFTANFADLTAGDVEGDYTVNFATAANANSNVGNYAVTPGGVADASHTITISLLSMAH